MEDRKWKIVIRNEDKFTEFVENDLTIEFKAVFDKSQKNRPRVSYEEDLEQNIGVFITFCCYL